MGPAIGSGLAGRRLDGARKQAAGHRLADPLEITHCQIPRPFVAQAPLRC